MVRRAEAATAPGRTPDRSTGEESGNQQGEAGAGAADGRRRAEGDRGRGGGGEEAEAVAGTGQVFVRAGWLAGGWGGRGVVLCLRRRRRRRRSEGGWKREWGARRVRGDVG